MEELWSKGEGGVDFDNLSRILEPDHFQCMFLIMGVIHSVGLVVLLFDILTAPPTNHLLDTEDPQSRVDQYDLGNQFYSLMLSGLSACLLITLNNLYFFSTALLSAITYDTLERTYYDSSFGEYFGTYKDGSEVVDEKIATPARTIFTGDYEIDRESLIKNKTVALAILGYGALTSFIFIFVAMIRTLGNSK